MIRGRLVTISIVALHLLVAVWAIAVFKPDTFRYGTIGESVTVMLMYDGGQLRLSLWLAGDPPAATGEGGFERYGFGYRAEINITPTNKVNRMYRVMMPMWALIAVCAFYPTRAFVRGPVARQRRLRLNQCPPCGYSLVGNTSGVCPECGSITPANARSPAGSRPTLAVELLFWRLFETVAGRRGGLILVVLLVLAIGIDVLRDRPWESAMDRVYRLCGTTDISRDEIDTAILGYRGGFSPGTPLFEKLMKMYSRGIASWSRECTAAMKNAASAAGGANVPPGILPIRQLGNPGPAMSRNDTP